MEVIKQFSGHSGSMVYLMEGPKGRFVRKIGNVERNYERLSSIKELVPVPEILYYDGEVLDMEYIHGQDMRTYLINNDPEPLLEFITNTVDTFYKGWDKVSYIKMRDFEECLSFENEFPFTVKELLSKTAYSFANTPYHGDMTLENIIHSEERGFIFIDPVTTPYSSLVFDLAKLRQDLDCKWFLRHNPANIETKLIYMNKELCKRFNGYCFQDDYLLITQLLRVFRHCKKDDFEYNFIIREVNRLWR